MASPELPQYKLQAVSASERSAGDAFKVTVQQSATVRRKQSHRKKSVFVQSESQVPPVPVKIPVCELRGMEFVLKLVAKTLQLHSGVKRLHTLTGTPVVHPADLKSGECYVAVCSREFKREPYAKHWKTPCKEECVHPHGDVLVPPVHIKIPKYVMKRLDDVITMVASKLHLRAGVSRLYTVDGRPIEDPKDLKSHKHYVAVGRGGFKPTPYRPEEPATCKKKSNESEAASPAFRTTPHAQDVSEDERDVKIADEGELKKIDIQEEPKQIIRRNTFVVPLSAVEETEPETSTNSSHDKSETQEDSPEEHTPTEIRKPENITAKLITIVRQDIREKQQDSPEKDMPTKIRKPEMIGVEPITICRQDIREKKQDSPEKDTPTKIRKPEMIGVEPITISRQDRQEKPEVYTEKDTPIEISKPDKKVVEHFTIYRQDRREKPDVYTEKETPIEIRKPVEYSEVKLLGKGGYGCVYAGYSKDRKVATKHIPLSYVQWLKTKKDGKKVRIPLEAALMIMAGSGHRPAGSAAAISLLDWYVKDDELILIMERPSPCCDLADYVSKKKGLLMENEAKCIMRQLVRGAADLHAKGIFHRDIKEENTLIEMTKGFPRVRIIDFGCGTLAKTDYYRAFKGTLLTGPPECFLKQRYRAVPCTVWQLGVVLYSLLGSEPFTTEKFLLQKLNMELKASQNCQNFLDKCLRRCPEERPDFKQLMIHPWLQ
ncbi:calcium-dependent protein kinase 2-like [Thalassophryne amazonica]|uniref:calcium-dependent protein kinase 2-like n=1 Tax=Thalassophryne amazonica TaxID=390379 RepID=UPI0014719487|nr:calcium-dependent protein kinase 2-like [Thalassophryne amazonica]